MTFRKWDLMRFLRVVYRGGDVVGGGFDGKEIILF